MEDKPVGQQLFKFYSKDTFQEFSVFNNILKILVQGAIFTRGTAINASEFSEYVQVGSDADIPHLRKRVKTCWSAWF